MPDKSKRSVGREKATAMYTTYFMSLGMDQEAAERAATEVTTGDSRQEDKRVSSVENAAKMLYLANMLKFQNTPHVPPNYNPQDPGTWGGVTYPNRGLDPHLARAQQHIPVGAIIGNTPFSSSLPATPGPSTNGLGAGTGGTFAPLPAGYGSTSLHRPPR